MHVFCTEDQSAVLARSPDAVPRVLPLPTYLDSQVVALLHLLLGEQLHRPVVLDASSLQRLCPVAALLLASTLRSRSEHGAPVQIVRISFAIRRQLEQHSLADYFAGSSDLTPAYGSLWGQAGQLHEPVRSVTNS
jgi:anti-anti-sigma regulatory factor